MNVVKNYQDTTTYQQFCGKRPYWRISESGQPNTSFSNLAAWQRAAQLSALIASAQQTLTPFTNLPATALGQTTGTGSSAAITLDTNAAGHGWYVDPTPLDNTDDYLPTSQSGVWQAKADSAAAGKMDMLSVLLHEYGHALGLAHSAEGGDFMNASLSPGMRKLPTTDQLALMSQLVAQLKDGISDATPHEHGHEQDPVGDHDHANPHAATDDTGQGSDLPPSLPFSMLGLLPFGFVRRSDGTGIQLAPNQTSANAALTTAVRTHSYMTALYPQLKPLAANASASNSVSNRLADWEQAGAVTLDAATSGNLTTTVTLGEAQSTAGQTQGQTQGQTRLAQAFLLRPNDRFLTFTVSKLDLQNNSSADESAPQDAFEVALLNATTGTGLWANGEGATLWTNSQGASRSDALLNLQLGSSSFSAGLQERKASVVNTKLGTDASGVQTRTYTVDLRQIAAGTPLNLSFDLIGFGSRRVGAAGAFGAAGSAAHTTSTVSLRDVRMISTPQVARCRRFAVNPPLFGSAGWQCRRLG